MLLMMGTLSAGASENTGTAKWDPRRPEHVAEGQSASKNRKRRRLGLGKGEAKQFPSRRLPCETHDSTAVSRLG